MSDRSPLQAAVVVLLASALLLPIVICVVLGVGFLLQSLGDAPGGAVLTRIALGGGILWILSLVVLLVLQALSQMLDRDAK